MSNPKIETNLRPIPEMRSALFSFLLGGYLLFYSSSVFLSPSVALPACLFYTLWGLYRLWGYSKVAYYQQHLVVSPRYEIPLSKVKALKKLDFYGRGFEWRSKHVARMEEASEIGNEKYLVEPFLVRFSKSLSKTLQMAGLDRLENWLTADRWWNPLRPLPEIGGTPYIHGVGLLEGEKDIYESTTERFSHREIIGTTRAGKSTAARLYIYQDIMRGLPVIVIDPKGDPDLLRATYQAAKDAGKLDKFTFFHLGHEKISARYSPMRNINRVTEVASVTTSSLPSSSHAASFKDFSWRYINDIALAMLALNEPITFKSILFYAKNIERLFVRYCEHWYKKTVVSYPDLKRIYEDISGNDADLKDKERIEEQWSTQTIIWMRLINKVELRNSEAIDDVCRSLLTILNHPKEHFQKLITNIYPLLEKLTTGNVGKILSPDYSDLDSTHERLDFKNIIKEKGIVYMGLAAMSDVTVASTVCSVACADIVTTLGEFYDHGVTPGVPGKYKSGFITCALHCDEANELMVDEFLPMVNKGGGSGLQVTVYTQSSADKEVKLGSKSKAQQVSSNFNIQMYFRVRHEETAREFTNQLGQARYFQKMLFSGTVDSPDPTSAVEYTSSVQERLSPKEVPLVSTETLINLPKGHAYLLCNGRLYKVRMPFTTIDENLDVPGELEAVMNSMRTEYSTGNNWYVDQWYYRQVAGLSDHEISSIYSADTDLPMSRMKRKDSNRMDDYQAVNVINTQELDMLGESIDDTDHI